MCPGTRFTREHVGEARRARHNCGYNKATFYHTASPICEPTLHLCYRGGIVLARVHKLDEIAVTPSNTGSRTRDALCVVAHLRSLRVARVTSCSVSKRTVN